MFKTFKITGIEIREYNTTHPYRVTFDAKHATMIVSMNEDELRGFNLGDLCDMNIQAAVVVEAG